MEVEGGGLGGTDEKLAGVPVGADLLEFFGVRRALEDLRQRTARGKLKSTFSHLIADIPSDETPVNPRATAGSLVEVALQPAAEDERNYEPFDERALRGALTLAEDKHPVPQPAWLKVDQKWDDEDKKRRKKHKKKKKRKKRDSEAGEDGEDSDRRKSKKRRKKTDNDNTDGDNMATDGG